MECNREEAIKAKELAIQKFSEGEYLAAKKLALKAQAMCPDLEGVAQFLAVLDVFISSEVKIGDETDWYAVLGVTSTSDEATIKKQYKAKALALHPDKNQSVGSNDAFRLILSAYRILSDRDLRAEHDAKRLRSERGGVFWTFCTSCGRYLQYREIFRGHVLLCKCCMNPFVADEVASPPPGDTSHRARRDGPASSSNPHPEPNPGWSWAHQGSSSKGPVNDTSHGFARDSSWDRDVQRAYQNLKALNKNAPIRVYVRRRKRTNKQ